MNAQLDQLINRRDVPALKVHPAVLQSEDEDLFAAGVADMDFSAPPAVLNALQKRLDHGVFGYEAVPEKLIPSLVHWLSNRHHWEIDSSHILRAPNILNILAIAASLFTQKGDGIIVQTPVFFDFFDIVNENKRRLIDNPLILENHQYKMDFDDLKRKASDPRTKMLYLCNPHNPVARVWRKDELLMLGDICARNGVLVVADEIHGDIVLTSHAYTPFASLGKTYADNCITCLSPAKTFNIASCCSAFTHIANDAKRQAFHAENSRLTVNKNNAFANVAMQAAYLKGENWLDDVLTYIERNIALVKAYLDQLPAADLIEPEGTFLVWLDFRKTGLDADELNSFLRAKAKWAITRGQSFGDAGVGFARLNVACPYEKLKAALESLKMAMASLN